MVRRIVNFYIDGFKNLGNLGFKLWIIIFIKLFIMFVILKIFFFPNILDNKFDNDNDKSEYIIKQIT